MAVHSYEVSQADFDVQVLQASHRVPVIVDFWAPWCAPCRALKPVLEKLALEHDGKFLLAKLNTDENQDLATRYGIRGIPNVKGFRDGAVAAEFSGALPESAVRTFLAKLMPSAAQRLRITAHEAIQSGDLESAELQLRESLRLDPTSAETRLDLVEILISLGAWPDADALIRENPVQDGDARGDKLSRQIAFWKKGQSLPSIPDFLASIQRSPDDLQNRMSFAEKLIADGEFEQALQQLMEVVQRNRAGEREAARKLMLQVFNIASDQPEIVARYRRSLASALH